VLTPSDLPLVTLSQAAVDRVVAAVPTAVEDIWPLSPLQEGVYFQARYAQAAVIADNTAPVSVALTRQMLWRMLGADHPMEAHRVDSRGILSRGASDDAREGVESFLAKRDPVYPVRVSDGLPDIFPDFEDPTFH
jgi:enoyl-CoA hydratase/carnithine racemase